MMKRIIMATMVAVFCFGSVGFGETLPTWDRGTEATTYQMWGFSTPNSLPDAPDDYYNPHGTPLLEVAAQSNWLADVNGHTGVWQLLTEIDMYIPNWPELNPEKEIWIQITWKAEDVSPLRADEPSISISPYDSYEIIHHEDTDLGDGWMNTVYEIHLYPNPDAEWIYIKGDIMIDELIIDTRCIPEPASVLLFVTGGLLAIRAKRRLI